MASRRNVEQSKQDRVKNELKRLEGLFEGVDANRRDFVQRQIEELAWLVVSISDLQKQIDADGAVLEYQNGRNQKGFQQNPAIKILSDYMKHSITIAKALLPIVPESMKKGKLAEFMDEFYCGPLPLDVEDI